VALNVATGKFVWGYQEVHHDEWDYDMPQAPTLFDMTVGGKVVHALDQPTKMGFNFVLNRVTGKPIIPAPETREPQSQSEPAGPGRVPDAPNPKGGHVPAPVPEALAVAADGGAEELQGPRRQPDHVRLRLHAALLDPLHGQRLPRHRRLAAEHLRPLDRPLL